MSDIETTPVATGAMAGVRVIDLTTIVMAASAAQMLADLGADVIKVESPEGDPIRRVGPYGEVGMGPLFIGSNRNKRGIALDLKQATGLAAFKQLLETADVLVCNVRPRAMQRLGLTYEVMSEHNPRLIYASLIGFSQRGRYGASPAFDDLIQAATGMPWMLAANTDGIPRYVPLNLMDRAVGLYAFGVISAALFARERSGVGQQVDVPMFETMVPFVLGDHFWGEKYVPPRGEFGYPRITSKARHPYRTLDNYVCCTIYTDEHWKGFLAAIGHGDWWTDDPRLGSIGARTANSEFIGELVRDEIAKRTTAEWAQILEACDIPVFPVHSMESLLADPHLADIDFFSEVEHPVIGGYIETKLPSEWQGTPFEGYRPAPLIGEHTIEILKEIGWRAKDIHALCASGAAAQHAEPDEFAG